MYVEQIANGRWIVCHDDSSQASMKSYQSKGAATREMNDIREALREHFQSSGDVKRARQYADGPKTSDGVTRSILEE